MSSINHHHLVSLAASPFRTPAAPANHTETNQPAHRAQYHRYEEGVPPSRACCSPALPICSWQQTPVQPPGPSLEATFSACDCQWGPPRLSPAKPLYSHPLSWCPPVCTGIYLFPQLSPGWSMSSPFLNPGGMWRAHNATCLLSPRTQGPPSVLFPVGVGGPQWVLDVKATFLNCPAAPAHTYLAISGCAPNSEKAQQGNPMGPAEPLFYGEVTHEGHDRAQPRTWVSHILQGED